MTLTEKNIIFIVLSNQYIPIHRVESDDSIQYEYNVGHTEYTNCPFQLSIKKKHPRNMHLDFLYPENLSPKGPPGNGTAFIHFSLQMAVQHQVKSITLRSCHGSWGFYYKLGFRPKSHQSIGTCVIDPKINLSMAKALALPFTERVKQKQLAYQQAMDQASYYFQKHYGPSQQTRITSKFQTALKDAYWNHLTPDPVVPRSQRSYYHINMFMNESAIRRFQELSETHGTAHPVVRLLGVEMIQTEDYEEFMSDSIPETETWVENFMTKTQRPLCTLIFKSDHSSGNGLDAAEGRGVDDTIGIGSAN